MVVLAFLKKMLANPVMVLILLAVTAITVLVGKLNSAEERALDAENNLRVERQNVLAAQDSTRMVEGRYRRRIMQVEQERDSIQAKLDDTPISSAEIVIDSQPEVSAQPTEERRDPNSETVVYSYDFPTAKVDVSVGKGDWLAGLPPVVVLTPKPIHITVRVSCDSEGVPIIDADADPSMILSIQGGSASPDVCNPVVQQEGSSVYSKVFVIVGIALVGVGALIG